MILLTEREISLSRDRLFAWGQGMNVPTPFANRTAAVASLRHILAQAKASDEKQIVCVSDILGSGKTFLINYVLNVIGASGFEIRFVSNQISESLSRPNDSPYQSVQVIDEWDIKARAPLWLTGLDALSSHYAEWTGTYVLIGDATLNCEVVRERLEALAPVAYFDLEPLTKPFFATALATRVADCFGDPQAEPFLDEGLVEALIPSWATTASTFRATFSVLEQLAQGLIPSEAPCLLGQEHVREWLARRDTHISEQAGNAAAAIIDHVRTMGSGVEPLNDESLGRLIQLECGSSAYPNVRTALLRAEYIYCLGIPQLGADGSYEKYRPPYLPGRRACLAAYASE